MASFRGSDVLLSWPVRHCLQLLAKSGAYAGQTTSDGIADDILTKWLLTNQPDLWQWVAKRREDEDNMVAALASTAPAPKRSKGAA